MTDGKADTDNGWMKLADEWALALMRAPLGSLEFRLVWWVIANTYGVRDRQPDGRFMARKDAAWTTYGLARDTGAARHTIRAAARRLLAAGVLIEPAPGRVALNRDLRSWDVRKVSGRPESNATDQARHVPWQVTDQARHVPGTLAGGVPGTLAGGVPGTLAGGVPHSQYARVESRVVEKGEGKTAHPPGQIDKDWFLSGPVSEPEPPTPAPEPAATGLSRHQLPACAAILADVSWARKWRPLKDSDVIPPVRWTHPTGPYRPDPQGRPHHGGVPANDPRPDDPYIWGQPQAGDWWVQPWVQLPSWPDVYALGIRALANPTPRGEDQDRRKPARWHLMVKALHGCARDFWEARGVPAETYRLPERVKAFWDLLPAVRLDACVRPLGRRGARAERPYELSRALARLWTVCAMTRPDSAGDEFWARKIKTPEDLRRHLPSLLKQVKEGEWPEREEQRYGQLGGGA